MNLSDWIERQAAFLPDKVATHFEGWAITYETFALQIRSMARGLKGKIGIGPGDRVILPRIVRALEAGRLPRIGRRRVLADLTVIDNVVLAVELALDSATHGGVYNITNGESLPLWDLVEEVCGRLELSRPRRRLPYRFVWLVAFGLEILHRLQPSRGEPIMTRYGVSLLGRSLTLDISAARRDLGYEPTVSVAEGTDRFIAWWRERS